MKHRLLCALLALLLLCPAALAQGEGLRLEMQFDMDVSAYPAEDQEMLQGVADMLRLLTVEAEAVWDGELWAADTPFDVTAAFSLGEAAASARLYGLPSHMVLESPLLGTEKVMFNMLAWNEFAIKAYFQLGVPLHHIAPFVSAYAHTSALAPLAEMWNGVMHAQAGSRTIPKEAVLDMLAQMAEYIYSDRTFTYWLQALLLDTGYDEMVLYWLDSVQAWAEENIPEEGIQVTVSGASQAWMAGDQELYTTNGTEGYSRLAGLLDGNSLLVSTFAPRSAVQVGIGEGNAVLDLHTGVDVSEPYAGITEAAWTVDVTGEMLPEAHWRWTLALQSAEAGGYRFRLSQRHSESNQEMLVISGTAQPFTPEELPAYTPGELIDSGVNIFSVYEDTLADFLHAVTPAFITQAIPLLAALPASTYQTIFDFLETYGIFEMLLAGV